MNSKKPKKVKMNADLKQSFSKIKPICDIVMVYPTPESISNFVSRVTQLKKEVVQELQQYLLFPFITHLKSTENDKKFELQWRLVEGMRIVLDKVTINNYEMCMKIETSLLQLVFDNGKPGMIADVPEELKLSVMKCLTSLMLNIDKRFREKLLRMQVPLLAQAVFVSVHIAKLEKLRALRLAAINCVTVHTMMHPQMTDAHYQINDEVLEGLVVEMLASILPGVLAALQDVATCVNNPGHAVIVASIDAIHRILCLTMGDRFLSKKPNITAADFANSFRGTLQLYAQENEKKEVNCKEKHPRDIPKRSVEWYRMASDKLVVVTKSLLSLRTHEHHKVRKELAIFCCRILNECTLTMQPSIPMALDVAVSLRSDAHAGVAQYCERALQKHFQDSTPANRHRLMENLADNFYELLNGLPDILNNIDSDRKMWSLNLLYGYVVLFCDAERPQRLTTILSALHNMRSMTSAFTFAAMLKTNISFLACHAVADVSNEPPMNSPWLEFRFLDNALCQNRLRDICVLLAASEPADLLLDRLLEMLQHNPAPEIFQIINWLVEGSTSENFISRILDTYLAEELWYLPLEVTNEEEIGPGETCDISVYNPRAWTTDRTPGLYEGAIEVRYTGVSYSHAKPPPRERRDLKSAQTNVLLTCLLTSGVGAAARSLGDNFQKYMLKTLGLLLERVGSKYKMVHLAGLRALHSVAAASKAESVGALLRENADYFTHQVTVKLKKAWDSESALQILSVVMDYSDESVMDCLFGIVNDVLVQSCDKYYEKNLYAYLQVFLKFVDCVGKWFPAENSDMNVVVQEKGEKFDLFADLLEYIKCNDDIEQLMSKGELDEDVGKSAQEMYEEDMRHNEENILDYDDKVTVEEEAVPRHAAVVSAVVRRCAHFAARAAPPRAAARALRTAARALPLLPRAAAPRHAHRLWAPLASRFEVYDPVTLQYALELLTTMATLCKDFIQTRCVKEVFPHIYGYLSKLSMDSQRESSSIYCHSSGFRLQAAILSTLPTLVVCLELRDLALQDALNAVQVYLSSQQPKQLQELAVDFFVAMFDYDFGATWYHLWKFCANQDELKSPTIETYKLEAVIGTPFATSKKDYNANIHIIQTKMLRK